MQVPKKKCSVPVVAPVNIAKIINQCQDEIKETLLSGNWFYLSFRVARFESKAASSSLFE